jgi:hypothetical protein
MSHEHSDEVERRLDQRRADTADLLGELRSRASVGYVSRQAMGKALPAITALGPAAGRTAARNPIGSALVSAGLTWILFGPEPDLPKIAKKAAAGTGSVVGKTTSTLSHTAASAIDTVGDAAGKVAAGGREIAGKVQEAGTILATTTRQALKGPQQKGPHQQVDSGLIAAAAFAGGIALGLIVMRRSA